MNRKISTRLLKNYELEQDRTKKKLKQRSAQLGIKNETKKKNISFFFLSLSLCVSVARFLIHLHGDPYFLLFFVVDWDPISCWGPGDAEVTQLGEETSGGEPYGAVRREQVFSSQNFFFGV